MTGGLTAAEYRQRVALQMTETALQSQVLRVAVAAGYALRYHTRNSIGSDRGFPDLVLLNSRTGRLVFAELKTQKGRIRLEQQEWLTELRAAGAEAYLWRPTDLLEGTIQDVLTTSPTPAPAARSTS